MQMRWISEARNVRAYGVVLAGFLILGAVGHAEDKNQKPANQPQREQHQPPAQQHQTSAQQHQPPAQQHQPPAQQHQPPAAGQQPARTPNQQTHTTTTGGFSNGAMRQQPTAQPVRPANPGGFNNGGQQQPRMNPGGFNGGGQQPGNTGNAGGSNNGNMRQQPTAQPVRPANPGSFNNGAFNNGGQQQPRVNPGGFNGGGQQPGNATFNSRGVNQGGGHQNYSAGHPTMNHNPQIYMQPSHGSWESTSRTGSAIRMRPGGHVSDVYDARRGMDIHHGLNGGRTVMVVRPDHSRVVFDRGRPGFVERPYSFHGREYDRRTYYYNGRMYDHFYHPYSYRGVSIHVYAPSRYYGPRYYGWAYNPWRTPVYYHWGWTVSPWYGHFGFYFTPFPVYPSAAFWLTDYLLAADLAAAYSAEQEGGGMYDPGAGAAPLSPEVKQQIADEVRNQIALENQEAEQNAEQQEVDPGSSGIARIISDVAAGHAHVFVVSKPLDVVDRNGAECTLSDGDVLRMQNPPDPNGEVADLSVLASKGGPECPRNDMVGIGFADLQEMQNDLRANIDQGLQQLQDNQGQGGLPAPPPMPPPQQAGYAAIAPPPDPNVGSEIQQQGQIADEAQTEVTNQVDSENGNGPQ